MQRTEFNSASWVNIPLLWNRFQHFPPELKIYYSVIIQENLMKSYRRFLWLEINLTGNWSNMIFHEDNYDDKVDKGIAGSAAKFQNKSNNMEVLDTPKSLDAYTNLEIPLNRCLTCLWWIKSMLLVYV